MSININHLRHIDEVAKTRSISQAAENLFMSQPNLSKSIRDFEQSVGFQIFKRAPKGIELTRRGSELLAYARNILLEIDEMERIYGVREHKLSGFGLSAIRASYISHAFAQFINSLSPDAGFEFDYEETNSLEAIEKVSSREHSLGIIRMSLGQKPFFSRIIAEKHLSEELLLEREPLVLVSSEHILARNTSPIDSEVLCEFVQLVHGDVRLTSLDDRTSPADIRLPKRRIFLYDRGSQFDLLRQVKDSYMWVSPIPGELLTQYGLTQIRVSNPGKSFSDMLIYAQSHRFTAIETRFIETLRAAINDIDKIQ